MKASEFVRKFGLDEAKRVLRVAPKFQQKHFCMYPIDKPNSGDVVNVKDLKNLVESHDLIRKMDFWGETDRGLIKAKTVIENNTLQASYYQPSTGTYLRYGHNSIYVVRNNEWKEIYGGMDSNSLIHTDRLKQAIVDVEACQ